MQGTSFRRGLVAVALLAALDASAENIGKDERPNTKEPERTQQQQATQEMRPAPIARQAERPAIVPENEPAKSRNYEYGCDAPESREDADACQSRRSADATVQQAILAEKQYVLGIIGLGATILAAGATAFAAWAAKLAADAAASAAKEASNANEIARDTAKRELRAYVAAQVNWVSSFNEHNFCWVRYNIINTGQTAANRMSHSAIAEVFPFPVPEGFAFPVLPEKCADVTAFPNLAWTGKVTSQRKFTIEEIRDIISGAKRIFVYGELSYVDIFEKTHITKFGCTVTGKEEMLRSLTSNYLGSDLSVEFQALAEWNYAD